MSEEIRVCNGYATIDENKVKQHFSEHIFAALCAHSNYEFDLIDGSHDYGCDIKIKELTDIKGKISSPRSLLRMQIKSTVNWELRDGHIVYKLKNKAFNDMVHHNQKQYTPLLLVLFCLPEEQIKWFEYDEQEIYLRKSLFWYNVKSKELKDNPDSKTTIKIPIQNRFKLNTLTKLVDKFRIQRGGVDSE